MSNLMAASHQWATRPDDERFNNVQEMHEACKAYAQTARVDNVPFAKLAVEAKDNQILLTGSANGPARLTHYAFGQLSRLTGSPADYLRSLPSGLAADCLNSKLSEKARNSESDSKILFHEIDGSLITRAVNTEKYDRIWNYEITGRMGGLLDIGFRVPPARPAPGQTKGIRKATASDILPNQGDFALSVKEGDDIAPAGLYASDHDMFAFLVHPDRAVRVAGLNGATDRHLMRGLFIRNSEVGDGALVFSFFLLDNVCGNHIVWGAENVHEIRVRHIAGKGEQNQNKSLERAVSRFNVELAKYSDAAASETEEMIRQAQSFEIGANRDDVIDACFKYAKTHSLPDITKGLLNTAYDLAESHASWYGSPRSAFGMVSGLTEASQLTGYADKRNDIDTQASALLKMAI